MSTENMRTQLAKMGDNFSRVYHYLPYQVMDQARSLRGVLEADLPRFIEAGVPISANDPQDLADLIEILVEEGADKVETQIDSATYREQVEVAMQAIRDRKEEAVIWARASNMPVALIHINMGQGSVPRFIAASKVLLELLKRHRSEFAMPERIDSLRQSIEKNLTTIETARVEHGIDKVESKVDTHTIHQATRALYDLLLKISRFGQALFFGDLGKRNSYKLSLLQSRPGHRQGPDDDDAPILEPAVASAAGVATLE